MDLMPIVKSLYRKNTGEILGGVGTFEPSIPQIPNPSPTPDQPTINDPDIGVAVYGDVLPDSIDPRIHLTNGTGTIDKSPEVIAAQENSEQFAVLRTERNARLVASDWTQSPDSPLSATPKTAWAVYRQALRDLPATTSDPANPVWPTEPA
jgi:hypothetical protein